jgi:hypothetical protein
VARRERGRERGQRLRHARGELLAAALLEERARMRALERLDDHQLGAQEADAVDGQRRRLVDL